MSTYNTPNLGIVLPTPGSSEPFSVSGLNADFETIDTWAGGVPSAADLAVVAGDVVLEAEARAAEDVLLDGRLDVLEARPHVFVQDADPVSGMVAGDLRFW